MQPPVFRHFKLFLFCIVLFSQSVLAQSIAIGQWREHLSYTGAYAVTMGNGKIYCAAESGIFTINLNDNSFDFLSRTTGLSAVNARKIAYNNYNNTLIIGYNDANIDIIQNNVITNLADIKRKQGLTNKTIYSIFCRNNLAYICCGFGIVVIDTDRKEIKETYFIGPNGSSLAVRAITTDGNSLYAATDAGIYTASLSNINLADYNSWQKAALTDNGVFNTIEYFNGIIYACFSKQITNKKWGEDVLYKYDGTQWTSQPFYNNIKNIKHINGYLLFTYTDYVEAFDVNFNSVKVYTGYIYVSTKYPSLEESYIDPSLNIWTADIYNGIIFNNANNQINPIAPSGPGSTQIGGIDAGEGKVVVVAGGTDVAYNNQNYKINISFLENESWKYTIGSSNPSIDSCRDLNCVVIDPKNKDVVYSGTWNRGLIEYTKDQISNYYTNKNSSLSNVDNGGSYFSIRVGGLAYDEDHNLWATCSNTSNALHVKKDDGSWKGFSFSNLGLSIKSTAKNLIVTKKGQKWFLVPRFNDSPTNKLVIYNDDGTMPLPNNQNTIMIPNTTTDGGIPGNKTLCMAEDDNGEVWVGTDKGVVVFYSPEKINPQVNASEWKAQEVLLEQDGHVQKLLETETVTAIAIDGANQKWFGTDRSGVFLMSPDGTKQIEHFTLENSPLLSDNITGIAIDHKSGEVFFGTDKGLISYKGKVTKGGEEFENVYAYPNPVRPDFDGVIAIKGLVKDASIKITDVSGALIYSTKALGGQATWNGKDFQGNKAHTGVYLVYCSNEDGSQTYVTKILFVN